MDGECKELIHPLDKKPYLEIILFFLNFHKILCWINKKVSFY